MAFGRRVRVRVRVNDLLQPEVPALGFREKGGSSLNIAPRDEDLGVGAWGGGVGAGGRRGEWGVRGGAEFGGSGEKRWVRG